MKWIISNYKENLIDEPYKKEIKRLLGARINLIICPNDSQLLDFKEIGCALGSQDVNYLYNPQELKNIGVQYTIIGHSDKRKKYHETSEEINDKIRNLLSYGICPILCIGEKEEESNIKKMIDIELEKCLKGIRTDHIMIAYEPVWAIGSGKIPSIEKLIDIIQYIKQKTIEFIETNPIVVYGGGVNENTIEQLETIEPLDGYLIGSASLDINKLQKLIEVIE